MKIVEGHQNRVTGALIIDTLVVEIMEKMKRAHSEILIICFRILYSC